MDGVVLVLFGLLFVAQVFVAAINTLDCLALKRRSRALEERVDSLEALAKTSSPASIPISVQQGGEPVMEMKLPRSGVCDRTEAIRTYAERIFGEVADPRFTPATARQIAESVYAGQLSRQQVTRALAELNRRDGQDNITDRRGAFFLNTLWLQTGWGRTTNDSVTQ